MALRLGKLTRLDALQRITSAAVIAILVEAEGWIPQRPCARHSSVEEVLVRLAAVGGGSAAVERQIVQSASLQLTRV